MQNNTGMDLGAGGTFPNVRYFALWSSSWFLITILTQVPVICQMAFAAGSGSVVGGCVQDLPRHSMPFLTEFGEFTVVRTAFAVPFAFFFALLSLGLHRCFRWLWKLLGRSGNGSIVKNLVMNGFALGILETLLLGIPCAILIYETADITFVDSACAYAYTNKFLLLIESGGISISYFAASVIAAVFTRRKWSRSTDLESRECSTDPEQ